MSVTYWGVGKVIDHIACLKLEKSDGYYGEDQKLLLNDLRDVLIKWLSKMPQDDHYYVELNCCAEPPERHGPYIVIGMKVSHQRGPKDNLSREQAEAYQSGEIGLRESLDKKEEK